MKTIYNIMALLLVACGFTACEDDVDNAKSRHNFVIDIEASTQTAILSEKEQYETALNIKWTPTADYGEDYIVTYEYKISVSGSKADAITEYEDAGFFEREYTNGDLQSMLIDRFGMPSSSYCDVRFTITAKFDGPRLIVPDEASVTVRVKTYGPKQFEADELRMDGSAVGAPVKLTASENNARLYVWTGALAAGKVYFPVVYGDEDNAIVPASGQDTEIVDTPMEATVVDASTTHGAWTIPSADDYRVTVNFDTQTVAIIPTSNIVEIDKVYLAGTAVAEADVEAAQTLENESVYAFRGELKAGTLYLPILFDGKTDKSFVPATGNDIHDGTASSYTQFATSAAVGANKYWTIPADGVYRIVLDLDAKNITIRSAATDLKNTEVSFNKTYTDDGTPAANPYKMEVTELWMYGTFNNYGTDSGFFTGFQSKYMLKQSLANPNIFVYKGTALPRNTANDDNNKDAGAPAKSQTATVNFKVNRWNYNVYCYSADVAASRNHYSGYVDAVLGKTEDLTEGQGDNRYAFFRIPEGCNYVVVDIGKMTVVFDKR